MICPACGAKYQCTCNSCAIVSPSRWKISNMSENGDNWDETCPDCGKTESIHWWFDQNVKQYNIPKLKDRSEL